MPALVTASRMFLTASGRTADEFWSAATRTSQLGDVDQLLEGDVDRKVGEPVLGWGFLVARPIDQQPLFVLASQANSHAGEPRRQPFGRTFPPSDRLPGTFGERNGKLPDTDE